MFHDPLDPFASTTTTDPTEPPPWDPGGTGWWALVGGVWRWMTEPLPRDSADPI